MSSEVSLHRSSNLNTTLLLVDDSPENLTALGEMLAPNYRIRVATSGKHALRAANSEPRPDLILLDIMMPDMDGFEVLARLGADENTRDIPVIFVTALHDAAAEQRAFEMGAVDYIHKPINSTVAQSRIRAQLEAHAARELLRKNNERLANQVDEGAHALEQAQLQLLQSEKMAAMGQLAAGIAHEINNPIGFVGSNLGTLEIYLKDIFSVMSAYEDAEVALGYHAAFSEVHTLKRTINYDFVRSDIDCLVKESKEGIDRVRRIVRDLKDFSRVGDARWEWYDVHQCLDSTLNIVWNELKYKCTIRKNYGSLPQIRCIPSQLNQVFMNLLVNAAHAIETNGEISITTEAPSPETIRISISDTGQGIPPENLKRIFDAFFTTKPLGKGTGLGLSLSRTIIERHNGKMDVASTPGVGTTFTLTLPVTHEEEGSESQEPKSIAGQKN